MMVAMALRASSPILVGRVREVDRLREALDVVVSGESGVVLITGEAGVGKTRLVGELGQIAATRGMRTLVGGCVEHGESIWPLAPLREVFVRLVDELDPETLDDVLGGAEDILEAFVPAAMIRGAQGSRGSRPRAPVSVDRLAELIVGVFTRLARQRPVVLVVEDLHWSDTSTRVIFSLLAGVGGIGPLLLVGTYRPDVPGGLRLRAELAEIVRSSRAVRLDLGPLDSAATAELVGALSGDLTWAPEIFRRSDGNAFFIEELVAARRAGVAGIPPALRDVVLARAAKLDDTSACVLRALGATGRTTRAIVAAASGWDLATTDAALERLSAEALLEVDGDGVEFRHELVGEVFADQVPPGERQLVHARVAAALESFRPDRPGEIAHHWLAAGDLPRALAASIAAGREALAAGAAAEAEDRLRQAITMWGRVDGSDTPAGIDHAGLFVETAIAAEHAGRLDAAVELAREACTELAGVDAAREGQVWLLLRDLYRFAGHREQSIHAAERAVALIPVDPPSPSRVKALADISISHWYRGRANPSLQAAREAVAVAELVGDAESLVYARTALSGALELAGDVDGALTTARATLTLCDSNVSPDIALVAYNDLCITLQASGRFAEIPRLCAEAIAVARRTGLAGPRGGWLAGQWVAALVTLGRWDEAEHRLAELRYLLSDDRNGLAYFWIRALLLQDRLEEARPAVERLRSQLTDGYWAEDMAAVAVVVVELDARSGRVEQIIPFVDEVLTTAARGRGYGIGILIATAIAALADHIEAAGARRHGVPADRWEAAADRWIDQMEAAIAAGIRGSGWTMHHRDWAHAELARLRARPDATTWARLAAAWQRLGAPYEEAYARWRCAQAMLSGTQGRSFSARHGAQRELEVAATLAARIPVAPLLAEINGLARRAHLEIGPSLPATADDLGLTDRELDVLALLADGRTNGQIATTLFISTKTASVHVSNILRKLGVANRVEAAQIAHRRRPSNAGH
jgi:DNA-binding CsgD family transcriptional regulator/tetratricopeptide (TPR) repeat protein